MVTCPDGVPLAHRIWRGCTEGVGPGDFITVVHGPAGDLPPRGLDLAASLLAFAAAAFLAVIRSYRGTETIVGRSPAEHG
ncbi:hypothetical protein [Streptomyces sp. NPDC051561]|uniref:hypothetical protein n=1 Tax=Streptomyces sp. NPDC051561 TaxID=3365658 RepID=UPI0037B60610